MTTPEYNINTIIKRYRTNVKGEAPVYIKLILDGQKMELSTNLFIQPGGKPQQAQTGSGTEPTYFTTVSINGCKLSNRKLLPAVPLFLIFR